MLHLVGIAAKRVVGPFPVPVGRGQTNVSEPNGDGARNRSEADDPRKGEPYAGDSFLITNGRGT